MLEGNESVIAIGKRLRRLRQMAGLSREQLASKAEVGRTSISYWEHGKSKSSPMTPRSMAKILGTLKIHGVECDERWLLSGLGLPPRVISPIISEALQPEILYKDAGASLTAQLDAALNDEVKLFMAFGNLAAVVKIDNPCMAPIFEAGDTVGGLWQPSASLDNEKVCIVTINEKLQVRKIRRDPVTGLLHATYMVYDALHSEPFEINNLVLEKVAPVIRMWR